MKKPYQFSVFISERSIDLPRRYFSTLPPPYESNASFGKWGKPDIYKRSPRSHIRDYDRDLFQSKSGSKKKTHRRCIPNTGHQP